MRLLRVNCFSPVVGSSGPLLVVPFCSVSGPSPRWLQLLGLRAICLWSPIFPAYSVVGRFCPCCRVFGPSACGPLFLRFQSFSSPPSLKKTLPLLQGLRAVCCGSFWPPLWVFFAPVVGSSGHLLVGPLLGLRSFFFLTPPPPLPVPFP